MRVEKIESLYDKKLLVQERLDLIIQLDQVRESFRDPKKRQQVGDSQGTHPFRHFDGLRVYLALTCFDILGQADEWMDYGSWLKASRKKAEREAILARCQDSDITQWMSKVNEAYNNMYGVKSGFYRFMHEMLSEENRLKLLRSIQIAPKDTFDYFKEGDSHTKEQLITLKERFLFSARNLFTHQGIPSGSAALGIFTFTRDDIIDFPFWVYTDEKYSYFTQRWPDILVEIVQDTLNYLPSSAADAKGERKI